MTIFSFLKNDRLVCKYKLTNAQIVKKHGFSNVLNCKNQCAQTVKITI